MLKVNVSDSVFYCFNNGVFRNYSFHKDSAVLKQEIAKYGDVKKITLCVSCQWGDTMRGIELSCEVNKFHSSTTFIPKEKLREHLWIEPGVHKVYEYATGKVTML